jgi:hypothetical protein
VKRPTPSTTNYCRRQRTATDKCRAKVENKVTKKDKMHLGKRTRQLYYK